jgi:hypothetical protein
MAAGSIVATKMYGYDWWTGGYEATADALAAAGTNLVLAQNPLDPLPASDVAQVRPGGDYDDLRLRRELRARGIRCFESTAMFFQPDDYWRHPDLRPVGADGTQMQPADWYVGLCPSSEEYLEQRVRLLRRVVTELEADGLFVSFIRFPGFWETWTPGTDRKAVTEYCFCSRCRRRFSRETGHAVPDDARSAAALLQGELRPEWTRWKCDLITGVVRRVREAVLEVAPGTEVMINKVPFIGAELGGFSELGDVGEEVLGQRAESLSEVTDYFEVMVYHQILMRAPATWIPEVVSALRARTTRAIIPCLQVRPTYTEGIFAGAGRRPQIGPAEFREAVTATAASGADGIMTYHWSDVLGEDATSNGAFSRALAHYAAQA